MILALGDYLPLNFSTPCWFLTATQESHLFCCKRTYLGVTAQAPNLC